MFQNVSVVNVEETRDAIIFTTIKIFITNKFFVSRDS